MRGIRKTLAQSLATKVILSTVLLSLGVISLTGSALNSRLSDGIRSVSLDSALTEARFTFFNAQYQLILSQGKSVEERKQVIAGLVVEATTQDVNEDSRDIILLKFPNEKNTSVSYEMASALVDPKSVPESLRERVRASKEAQYEYAQNRYLNSLTTDALFVGEPIKIPGGGMYEMYVVFTLNTKAETLTQRESPPNLLMVTLVNACRLGRKMSWQPLLIPITRWLNQSNSRFRV
jgi:two-component system sensor histidine kinase MtrB